MDSLKQTTDQESILSDHDRGKVRLHLQKLLGNPAFAHSNRSQEFLRYIVEEALAGRAAQVKERNIGVDVFGRDQNFDPQQESLVRVAAGEVRKRLLQAYQKNFGDGVQIELPIGSYCPKFTINDVALDAPEPAPAPSLFQASHRFNAAPSLLLSLGRMKRRRLTLCAFLLCTGSVAVLIPCMLSLRSPLDLLWQAFAKHKQPVLIALPAPVIMAVGFPDSLDTSHSAQGVAPSKITVLDEYYTGTGAGWGAARFAEQLAFRHQPFILRFGKNVSFPDVEQSPAILLGGGSSLMGTQMTRNLRYRIIAEDGKPVIVDTFNRGKEWSTPRNQPISEQQEGYTLITILRHTDSGYPLMIVAGMQPADTQAGAEFLTNNQYLLAFTQVAPKDWQSKNCQIVLHNPLYGNSPGRPTVAAWYVW
jgi:hypothetical protein